MNRIDKLNLLMIVVVMISIIYSVSESTKNDQYCNRIVQDIKTGEKFVRELNEIVEVGDTITVFMDTTKVTVKVIK